MKTTRRNFMTQIGSGFAMASVCPHALARASQVQTPLFRPGEYQKINSQTRQFHLSVTHGEIMYNGLQEHNHPMPPNPETLTLNAQNMIDLWKEAGVTDLWLQTYGSGLYIDAKTLATSVERVQNAGLRVHFLTVPVGHPNSKFTPEIQERWGGYTDVHGNSNYGVSVHEEVAKDCVKSVRAIADQYGACDVFLDDDFRFAVAPDSVGGCVCPKCKADFMQKAGFSPERWDALRNDLRDGHDSKDTRQWLDYFCDRMTKTFRDTQTASPEIDLGIMVMGMGSEKAGVRLDDYRSALLRVGEWMFTDAQYNSLKNRTIELFSVLFHSQFVPPGRAFSETTIIQELSAENYVSKLSTSTLSDVRNTMFMCPIPASYWGLIAPRMKREARYHSHLLGIKARGPFKHYWGLADRYNAGYNGYSLALATGVPFEVCSELPSDGWAFLGDYSAQEMERGELASGGTQCVARIASSTGRFRQVPESLEELFKFRRELLAGFRNAQIPYIEEETPVVLGWYPEAKACYLWNIDKADKVVTLRQGDQTIAVKLKALDSTLILRNGEHFTSL